MSASPDIAAVLTGDIVRSTALSAAELDATYAALEAGVERLRSWDEGLVLSPPGRFRGDGWQLALGRPGRALRACLLLRAAIRAGGRDRDTRIAVGLGRIDALDPDNPGAASGPAFLASGRRLDTLKSDIRLDIDPGDALADEQAVLSALFGLCDEISRRWTPAQAEILLLALAPDAPTQAGMGAALSPPVRQQSVADHLQAAGAGALLRAVGAFEAHLAGTGHA